MTFTEEKRIYKHYSYSPVSLTFHGSFYKGRHCTRGGDIKSHTILYLSAHFLEIGNVNESQVLCPKSSSFLSIKRSWELLIL